MFQATRRLALYLIATAAVLVLAGCSDGVGDKYVSFAKCLNQKGVTMYGAYWCPHCANQKKLFGELGFAEVNYVECDPNGKNAKPELCYKNKVQGFPTWIFPDGTRTQGETSLEELSQKSTCPLPNASATPAVTPPTSTTSTTPAASIKPSTSPAATPKATPKK